MIKKDPSKSMITDASENVENQAPKDLPLNTPRILIIIGFMIVIFFQIYGSLQLGWYLPELSAIYLMLGVAAADKSKTRTIDVPILPLFVTSFPEITSAT